MRRHAPMWEAELGDDDGINDIDVHARKFHDDMETTAHSGSVSSQPNWPHILAFLGAVAIFLLVASRWIVRA